MKFAYVVPLETSVTKFQRDFQWMCGVVCLVTSWL